MCGIVGITGDKEAAPIILETLKKLEYRGYDSAGIATLVPTSSLRGGSDKSEPTKQSQPAFMPDRLYEKSPFQLIIRKGPGKLAEVEKACGLSLLPGACGIGHVRWATHGQVNSANAHPHTDCRGQLAVVHNGIIDNYRELKEYLSPRHHFTSDTDTEVIAHLIEEELEKVLPDGRMPPRRRQWIPDQVGNENNKRNDKLGLAVYTVTQKLRGSFALLVLWTGEPDKIVAACRDSPLVVGLGENANYIASDTLCFPEQVNRIIYIEDGEIVAITRPEERSGKQEAVSKIRNTPIPSPRVPSGCGEGEDEGVTSQNDPLTLVLSRGGERKENKGAHIYDSQFHEVARKAVPLPSKPEEAALKGYPHFMLKEIMEQPQSILRALHQDKKQLMDMAIDMLRAKQIVLTACGTSRYAALVGRYAFSRLAGIFSEVVAGSEFQYFSDSVDKNTVVIAVSQSGETADVIQGARKARENGAKVFSLVNTPGSTLARLSHHTLYLQCGPEIAVAATKSFISQLSLFYMLSFAMTNRLDEGIEKLTPLSTLIEKNLKHNGSGLSRLAENLKNKPNFYYIGRGINYAIAGEGALKLKETAYVHAEGMSAGELKHGTLALVEPGTPIVALCPHDYTFDETVANTWETKTRGAYVIGVSDRSNPAFDELIHIPTVEEIFYPLVSVIPLQLFAYYSTLARGYDPDKPRNLAKSVTVK